MIRAPEIRRRILEHFAAHQRDLPWRRRRDPYAIWVSEIMLQQTRVAAVIPYFERWIERFPGVAELARAELDDVLAAWAGLGYYSRARNLHRGAREVVLRHGGRIPEDPAQLRSLPGIGRYTAGAIASQAFGVSAAVVDGNVARVLARVFAVELDIKSSRGGRALWDLADQLVPSELPGEFNQGLMELGATVCIPKRPRCSECPLERLCQARADGRQTELPITPRRKRRAEKDEIHHRAAWIFRRQQVLLARRRPEGLFGGLWEIPQATSLPELSEALGRDLELDGSEPLAVHEQELSHRVLHIEVFRARSIGRARRLPAESHYDSTRWMSLTQASKCGLSSASQRLIELADEDQTWTSNDKR